MPPKQAHTPKVGLASPAAAAAATASPAAAAGASTATPPTSTTVADPDVRAAATDLLKTAVRLEGSGDPHEAIMALEQAKALLVGDGAAAAGGYSKLMDALNARTMAIFNTMRQDLYAAIGTSTVPCLGRCAPV